jgi:UDPglucose 6-dehydrogenase
MIKKVAMIGCGKLGLPCAEKMAEKYQVVGYDVLPFESNSVRSTSLREAVEFAELIFIAVPTPHVAEYGGETPSCHLEPKDFDYSIVKDILHSVNQYANKNQLVVLISTVLPGTVRSQLQPLITNARFIYNPYLIAMGSVAWDMVNPEMVIIGTEDGSKTGDSELLINFYKEIMLNNPRYEIGTWDEAESIKIFYNTFISAKIGIVNMIQDVAEKLGNINVDVVTQALSNSTMRITGPAYLKAGMGDSGACHPRDNIALRWLSKNLDLNYDIFETIMFAREMQAKNIAKKLIDLSIKYNKEIWIHGKSYKPGVPYIQGSYSLLIEYYVNELGKQVKYVDPLTGDNHSYIDGIILMAHHAPTTYGNTKIDELKNKQNFYAEFMPGSVVVDMWRYLNQEDIPQCILISYGNTRH